MKRIVIYMTLILTVVTSPDILASSTSETIGFSPEGVGMGNAVVSIVNDWSSTFYNMAGLGRTTTGIKNPKSISSGKTMDLLPKNPQEDGNPPSDSFYPNEIYLGFLYTYPVFDIDIKRYASDGTPVPVNPEDDLDYGAIMLGLVFDMNNLCELPKKAISSCRLGLGLVTNADLSVAQINSLDMRAYNWLGYGREAKKLSGFLGLGVGFLNDMFGLGIGVNASFAGEGKVCLDNVLVSSDPQIPEGQAKLDLSLSPYAVCGVYFDFGRMVSILEGLSMGSCYRQESYLEVNPFPTTAIIQNGNIQMLLQMSIFDYYSPHSVSWGISYSRWKATLSFDVEHQLWSRYRVSSAVQDVFERQIGVSLPKYEDIFIYKVGFSYEAVSWMKILAGYCYQPTFIPAKALRNIYNEMDNTRHIVSMGLTFTLMNLNKVKGPIQITVSYQLQYLEERHVVKDQAAIASDLSSGYPYYAGLNPNYSYGGMCHTVLMGISFKL